MDTRIFKDLIAVIRTEQERRTSLRNPQDPDFAYDRWLFTDEPFLNELCLMVLLTLRHQVERELVGLAARAAGGGKEISRQQYQTEVEQLRKKNRKVWNWEEINKRLEPKSCKNYDFFEALRHLANSYKHNPSMEPEGELLTLLKLKPGVSYAPLPESDSVREGLADLIGLEKGADYCDIAERFVDIASDFVAEVKSPTKLSKVEWGAVSLKPDKFAR